MNKILFVILMSVSLMVHAEIKSSQDIFNKITSDEQKAELEIAIKSGVDINAKDSKGRTFMMIASGMGFSEIVGLLISSGSNVNEVDLNNNSSLHYAAQRMDNLAIIDLLIKNGASLDKQNNKGVTPLMFAMGATAEKNIELLIKNMNNVDQKNINGFSALHIATMSGNTKVLELVIDKTANINQQSENGVTALMLAVGSNLDGVVKLLVTKGADVTIKNSLGKTALDYANENKNEKILQLLQK